MTVLIAYASALGSTREMAQHMASRMAGALGEVECRSVEDVGALSRYEAVVVGSAVHNQAWLPPALLFFKHHARELANRPVWAFSVGWRMRCLSPFAGAARHCNRNVWQKS